MISLVVKKYLVLLLISLSLLSSVYAIDYDIDFIEVDKFICKNMNNHYISYDDIIDLNDFNKNETKLFDIGFRNSLRRKDFELIRGWEEEYGPGPIFYFLVKNNSEYRIQVDNQWFYIRKRLLKNISTNDLENQYWIFRQDSNDIHSMIYQGLSSIGLSCSVGSNNDPLFDLVNIYGYPIDEMNCSYQQNSNNIDCKSDIFIGGILASLWPKVDYHNRRQYKWGLNRIFVDLDELNFNDKKYYDSMNEPMIVLSESNFAASLDSGQSIYVDHIKFLKKLEYLPIQLNRLTKDIAEIENVTTDLYKDLSLIKESWRSKDTAKTKGMISEYTIDYAKIDLYLERLGDYEATYDSSLELSNDIPKMYYEDIYHDISNKYLSEFNTKLFVFRNKLDALIKKQEFYDSFSNSIISDINEQERTNSNLRLSIIAVLITVLIFIMQQLQQRYGYQFFVLYFLFVLLIALSLSKLGNDWIIILFLLIGISILVWLVFPNFIIDYKEINTFFKLNDIGKKYLLYGIWYNIMMSLLFSFYIVFLGNSEYDLHNRINSVIKNNIYKTLKSKNEILELVKNAKFSKDELANYEKKICITKLQAAILTNNISALINHKKFAENDFQIFTNFQRELFDVKNIKIEYFIRSKQDIQLNILKETQPISQ